MTAQRPQKNQTKTGQENKGAVSKPLGSARSGQDTEPLISPALVGSSQPRPVSCFRTRRLDIPIYLYAVVFASSCVTLGLLWDIMWHMSIGRDGLFAPPHLVIYIGGVVSGLVSAYQILTLTLTKNHPGRAAAVPFWGVFYGPLGAMFCVWGALAMLSSAPFDDWWHNTYGLDVQVLTPPHSLLFLGIMIMQLGAMVGILAQQNQYRYSPMSQNGHTPQRAVRLKWLFAVAAGLLLVMLHTFLSQPMGMRQSHRPFYYITAAIILPFYLLAVGRASLLERPITTIAGVYMVGLLLPSWLIQLVPATPRLGPVLNPITHFQPFIFPLLLVIPGWVLDWLMERYDRPTAGKRKLNEWGLAALYAVAFMLVLLGVQWPFGEFLTTSPLARNGFFLSYSWPYSAPPEWQYRYGFSPNQTLFSRYFLLLFGVALLCATLSARVGLLWGNWMRRIVR